MSRSKAADRPPDAQCPRISLNSAKLRPPGRGATISYRLNSKDQQIELRTRGKSEGRPACHVVTARYDPATAEILPETVTSDWNWNLR